ncbi:MAG TPA: histidinol-phosphatase [Bacteroidales bacterium]|nr:histidinol-phosphatase [Bacteroidales bacterium]
MVLTNYHTHTFFCDGNSEPEKYITEAIRQGFVVLGFSAHAPLPIETAWNLAQSDLEPYCAEITRLKEKYKDEIEVLLSLEIDYIPGVSKDVLSYKKQYGLDYTIGAVHLVKNPDNNELWFIDGPESNFDRGVKNIFKNDIRQAVECYFTVLNEMIKTQKADIIAHFDKVKMNNRQRYFHEKDNWYQNLLRKTIEIIAQSKSIVEVNTRGIYTGKCDSLYPGTDVLKQCFEMDIPLTINSDAHKPADINSYFAETEQILKDIGYKSIRIYKNDCWTDWEI